MFIETSPTDLVAAVREAVAGGGGQGEARQPDAAVLAGQHHAVAAGPVPVLHPRRVQRGPQLVDELQLPHVPDLDPGLEQHQQLQVVLAGREAHAPHRAPPRVDVLTLAAQTCNRCFNCFMKIILTLTLYCR